MSPSENSLFIKFICLITKFGICFFYAKKITFEKCLKYYIESLTNIKTKFVLDHIYTTIKLQLTVRSQL